ncbi:MULTISPECIES: hypothetical protein [Thermomonospora]|uniref:Uncharacterized protein n=1 Tax=Thermomonospora curvata (strain ATCC 19995 / DSM 43183 / JCM 3096 / KCTC 9072 / NBRC 15933 / NCIMB 10081 / Henssen B9) TaxID=471852 RepID=D1A2N7_THECD|nr:MULTISPECIES: hypothetical protein [Thermomonospora]ACY97835.1 conserved hypothetical protein [Thermomonospora curvata DSM 43183]PKK14122.1 MAG: hypothetical protein BUE48_011100 [Thermomonospora sp. CIF 1]
MTTRQLRRRGTLGLPAEPALLGIYLNDHLAGATGGRELAKRIARAHRGTAAGPELERLVAEIAEDRRELLAVMRTLGVPVRRYKAVLGWLGERLGRLKPSGRLLSRSPLSSVIELETMRLGVEGKQSVWVLLRRLAEYDRRLDAARLDRLADRAARQSRLLEELRVRAADDIFGVARQPTG